VFARVGLCVHVYVGAQTHACVSARVALLIQHATLMLHILSFVTSPAPPNSLTLSHKRHDFRKEVTGNKMCILIFSTTFKRFRF
jgi:hypothetical protein